MQQRAEEHDDGAGPAGGVRVDGLQVELRGRQDLQVDAVVDPAGAYADGVEDLEEPEDLLDAGDPAQHGAALVEQGAAEQRDARVLARLDVDGAREATAADHTQMHGSGVTDRHDLAVEGLTDAGDHLKADVLVATLDAIDRALARGQRVGELGLCPATVLTGVTDELADTCEVVVFHGCTLSQI